MASNKKRHIVIAGGGFAGMAALDCLWRSRRRWDREYRLVLIDRKETFDFLPLAPDVLAGRLSPEHARVNLKDYCRDHDGRFIQASIKKADILHKKIFLNNHEFEFEYLILASGCTPNFIGNENARKSCLTLNSIQDSLDIQKALVVRSQRGRPVNVVVIGGGYTGLEAATASLFFMQGKGIDGRVYLIEKAPEILVMVDDDVAKTSRKEIERLGIKIHNNDTLTQYEENRVTLKSGRQIENAVCIWTAGVECASFVQSLEFRKIKSRIQVDPHLNISDSEIKNVFCVGDNAAFLDEKTNQPLRQAIMFAKGQAQVAARNILRSISSHPPHSYKPFDLGYLVPLVYNKAPGIVLGMKIHPSLGYLLHYAMCVCGSKPSKRSGIIKGVFWTSRSRVNKQ